jgi:cytochrome c553
VCVRRLRLLVAAILWPAFAVSYAHADMIDMTGVEPWHFCGSCHGLDGTGNRVKFPRLAGQNRAYILKQLNDFRDGHRQNDGGQMLEAATELNETTGIDGILACVSCHSAAAPALAGSDVVAPRLAGQRDFYIAKQLADFRSGERDNDPKEMMRNIAKRLSDTDITALAVFLSQTPALHESRP